MHKNLDMKNLLGYKCPFRPTFRKNLFQPRALFVRTSWLDNIRFQSLLGLRVRCLVSEKMSSSTDNLLVCDNGKLVKWKQGVFDSRF